MSHIQWVYNILERKVQDLQTGPPAPRSLLLCGNVLLHKYNFDKQHVVISAKPQADGKLICWQAEAERLLFEDPDPETGFMLHPDLKCVL